MARFVSALSLVFFCNSLFAQEIQSTQDSTPTPKNVEKLEVTGSYIKRIDTEGPSPVMTFDRESLDRAGVNTMSDYIRESPLFGGATDNGNRDGYFEFRGQHAGSTLVLINGMRVPKLGGPDRGFYSGIENIPTNIVERTEILKDGSSALYGSDAMAGVMNFITRKDYDGAEYSTRINIPEINQGLEQQHTITFGKAYARGSWFASTQFVEQRAYTESNIGNYYNRDSVGLASQKSVTTFADSKQNTTDYQPPCKSGATGNECPIDYRNVDYVRNARQNLGTILSGRYDLNSNVNISMLGIYNHRKRMDIGRPNFININEREGDSPLESSKLKSNDFKQKVAGSDFFEFAASPIEEVGLDQVAVTQNSYSAQSKIEGYYLDTWRWDLTGSYAYSLEERNHMNGLVDKDAVRNILYSSDYNLAGSNPGAFSAARVQGVEAYEASMTSARLLTTGELFDLNDVWGAGGPVSMAMGVEGQWETTADAHDAILFTKNLNQNFEPNQEGGRTVNSVFTEFVLYPIEAVELQLAGRYDRYSDFGDTFNPKVSLGYRPSQKVLLRTSWGTNFNAPSVRNMIQRDMIRYEDIQIGAPGVDPSSVDRSTVPVTRYRDPNLHQEKGVNYNFGTVIQANKNWSFSVDQWNFIGQGSIAQRSGFDYSDLYNAIGEKGLKEQAGVTLERDATGRVIAIRAPAVTNMGTRTIHGFDINVSFHSPVRLFGRVMKANFRSDQTHMMKRKTKYTDASEFINYPDLEWKNNTSFSLSTTRHSYRLAARTLPGDTSVRYQTRTQTEYDLNYIYRIPYWTATLSLGVKNVLNTRPPVNRGGNFVDFTSGFTSDEFLPLGRRYYVGYEHAF